MRSQQFRIVCGADKRWYVSHCSGSFKVYRFPTQVKAEEFAQRWAIANQPSVVRETIEGETEKEWRFGEETPGIRRQS